MSNILTDILGFFKRRKFAEQAKDNDVLILGVNESPDMLGIASPVPYKDVKLITVKSLLGSNLDTLYQNTGSGSGVYSGQSTVDDQKYENFRSLKSVSLNLTINQTASEIQFNTTAEPNTAANVGSGVELYKNKVGETLNFRSIISSDGSVGVTQSTNEIDLTASGSGEVNTASNAGAGDGVFKQKSGVDLEFKSLTAGTNITLTPSADEIQISAAGGSGEVNTASNVGTGAGQVFKQKTGVDLELKTIKAGTNVTVTNNADDITISSTGTGGEVNTASNIGAGTGLFKQKTAEDLEFYSLTSSDNSIDVDLVTQDNVIDLKATTSSNTQAAGTFLQGARFVYDSPTDLTYFNTAITAVTAFGFGYFNLPDVSGIPTDPLTQISFGNRSATDPVGDYVENYMGISLGNPQTSSIVDWPNLPATARIKVIFTCYAEASVPPTVIYLGLHHRNFDLLDDNTELEYGWQAVGVDPDTDNQLTQVQATWIIDVDDVVDTQGRSLRTDSSATSAYFGFYGGSNASRDRLLFGAQWDAEIPNAIDQQWTGPGIVEVHLLDNNPTGRFSDNPFTRS
jgi:hypothetical protein